MRDLNDTLIFVRVVEQGSFIAAARALGLPKTTVSRRVQELEARLGSQLLHRTTRRLGLTEAGAVYYEHSQRIARELDEAESAVNQLQSGPRGWLRFTVAHVIGNVWIAPLLGEFHRRHPELRIEMLLSNETLDLIGGEIDVALRAGPLQDSSLVARRLGAFRSQLYAAPAYVEQYGEPQTPEELQYHRTLALTKNRRNGRFLWTLGNGERTADFPIDPLMVSNEVSGLKGALLCGEGLMLAPDVLMRPLIEAGVLRRVLAGWQGPTMQFSAVFPRGRTLSPKVRVFVDFLVERLNFDVDYMTHACPCPGTFAPMPDRRIAAEAERRVMPYGVELPEPEPVLEDEIAAQARRKRRAA